MDILYLAKNRIEFTKASLDALIENTNWAQVTSVSLYDDGSIDGTYQCLRDNQHRFPVHSELIQALHGSPVAVMNDFIVKRRPDLFAKIDNDVVLPPQWLDEAMKVVNLYAELDLLGIEAMYKIEPDNNVVRGYEPASYIGGIGIMRGRAFQASLPRPDGRFGFTAWQDSHAHIKKGWLSPSLPVILLDRLPFQPWASLSGAYVAKGWQRPWQPYDATRAALWEWWKP